MSLQFSSVSQPVDNNRLCKFKIVVLGEHNVGKSSIVNRFVYDRFEEAYDATIGIDFLTKTFYFHGRKARLQLWDTAGQERYASLIPGYIRNGSIAIVVYDITERKSFAKAGDWVEKVRFERDGDAVILLVGNKTDLEGRRRVTKEEGEKRAHDLNVSFIEVSAKEGYNIKIMFRKLVSKMPDWEAFEFERGFEDQFEMEDVKLKANEDLTTKNDEYGKQCAC